MMCPFVSIKDLKVDDFIAFKYKGQHNYRVVKINEIHNSYINCSYIHAVNNDEKIRNFSIHLINEIRLLLPREYGEIYSRKELSDFYKLGLDYESETSDSEKVIYDNALINIHLAKNKELVSGKYMSDYDVLCFINKNTHNIINAIKDIENIFKIYRDVVGDDFFDILGDHLYAKK